MRFPLPGTRSIRTAEKEGEYIGNFENDCTRCAYVLCKVPKNGCKKSFHMKYYEKFRYK